MKKLWIITAVIVILGIVGGGALIYSQKKSQIISPGESVEIVATPTPKIELSTWIDDAGFSFQYPKDLATDKHEEDNDSYAHVELTHKDHPGNVIVWVKDLPKGVTTIDSWVKKDPVASKATVIDTTLAKQPAKKFISGSTITAGTLDDSLLFYVQGMLTDNEYWTSVFNIVTESFIFTLTDTGSGSAPAAAAAEAVDEEEIVE